MLYVIHYCTANGIMKETVNAQNQIEAICKIHPDEAWYLVSCVQADNLHRYEAYQKNQLLWMAEHGYSLSDIFGLVSIWQTEAPDIPFQSFFEERGFNGEIYPCFQEFLDAEYQDMAYMQRLLSPAGYYNYLIDIGKVQRFAGDDASFRLHGGAIRYKCNAMGELSDSDSGDSGSVYPLDEDSPLPVQLKYAYQNTWSMGYGFLCYLVETSQNEYGITLSYEAAEEISIAQIDRWAFMLATSALFKAASIYVGVETGDGGDGKFHELIVVFPATIDPDLFHQASLAFSALVDTGSFSGKDIVPKKSRCGICPVCGEKLAYKDSLLWGENEPMFAYKSWECPSCGVFGNERHIVHAITDNGTCPVCDRKIEMDDIDVGPDGGDFVWKCSICKSVHTFSFEKHMDVHYPHSSHLILVE